MISGPTTANWASCAKIIDDIRDQSNCGCCWAFAGAEAALGEVGLELRLRHYPSQLSGGEQQRVALARAVVRRPSLLLADEPTGNLDGATGGSIIDLMFRLHQAANSTLILITHDPALAARCDRIVQMRDGRLDAAPPLAAD
jgi:putative ABC transport system ATP-binding protein